MAKLEFVRTPYMGMAEAAGARPWEERAYYLCVCGDGRNALEIIRGAELHKPFYEGRSYRVIGMAGGRAEAFELTRRVIEDFLAGGRGFDGFRDYLRWLGAAEGAGCACTEEYDGG